MMRVISKLIVFNGTQLLVLKKKSSVTKYSLLGGGVKKRESPVEAVIRESREEGDLDIGNYKLQLFKANIYIEKKEVYVIYYYIVNAVKKYKLLEPHKFESLDWVELNFALPKLKKRDRNIIIDYINEFKKK